jgi:hypothetical protein
MTAPGAIVGWEVPATPNGATAAGTAPGVAIVDSTPPLDAGNRAMTRRATLLSPASVAPASRINRRRTAAGSSTPDRASSTGPAPLPTARPSATRRLGRRTNLGAATTGASPAATGGPDTTATTGNITGRCGASGPPGDSAPTGNSGNRASGRTGTSGRADSRASGNRIRYAISSAVMSGGNGRRSTSSSGRPDTRRISDHTVERSTRSRNRWTVVAISAWV